MKRVALNLFASHRIQTGIGTYLTGLVSGLSGIERDLEIVLVLNSEGKEIFSDHLGGFESFTAPRISDNIKTRVLYEHTFLSSDLKKIGIDLLHSPVFVSPFNYRGKGVLTVHDTTFITHPQYHIPSKRLYFKWGIPRSVKKCDKVVAISENTRKDLIGLYPEESSKFVYIPYGIKKEFFSPLPPEREAELMKFSLPENFILYVGVLEPRKNIEGIIKAFNEIRERIPGHKLVLAGRKGWYYDPIFELVRDLGLQDSVIHIGHVDYLTLPGLFRKASLFTYPSFYEGFGMPVLEAMASGCPVVTSDISSTKEIGGDGCAFADPNDVKGIASAMVSILSDPLRRSSLVEKGLKRAAEFSWESAAKRTMELYHEVLDA